MRRFRKTRFFFFTCPSFLVLLLSFYPKAHSESVTKFVTSEEKIREEMITISRELGVTCSECHNVQNFQDNSKKGFKVGKEHMKLTQMLKENGFDGKKGPLSTCFMCHRGKLVPDYKESISQKHDPEPAHTSK
ncbi:MAG: hypothetical protein ACXVCY_09380 [Pseudobdellovibrionaceae bacterium]